MGLEDQKAFEDALTAKLAGPQEGTAGDADAEPAEPADTADTSPPEPAAAAEPETADTADTSPPDDKMAKLRKQLEEKDLFNGRLTSELGELRKQVEQLQRPQQAPIDQQTVDWVDEAVTENPFGTAEWVRQNQPALYDRVMDQWFENDPRGASRYETELRLQSERQAWQAAQQPIQEQYGQQRLAAAWNQVATRHPDMNDLAQAMADVTERAPELLYALQQPGNEERALENLYLLARALQPAQAPPQPAGTAPADAKALRQDAYVASATSAQPEASPATNWEDQFKEQFRAAAAQRISISEELLKGRAA